MISSQSLKFVVEMRILVEMKIENHGNSMFPGKNTHTFFSMKIKMKDL